MAYDNVGPVHDVELGGFGLKLAQGTYQVFPIPPFAPRVASENPSHSTFDAYQAMTWDDWSHGFGFPMAVDAKGYNYTSGNVDTRNPHVLMLSTAQSYGSTPGQAVTCFQDFSSNLYAGMAVKPTNSTLWKYTVATDTWAEEATAGYPATKITDLLASKDASGTDKLFIALSDTSDIAFMTFTGAAYATPVASAYARLFAHAGGFMWYADRKNNVAYSDDPTAAWSALIPVGSDAHPITSICEFNGRLYIGKTNGVYYIDPGTDTAYPAITFNDEINTANCVLMKPWRGYLYAVVQNRLYQINGAGALSDITPPKYTIRWPFQQLTNFRGLMPARQFLYYVAEDSSETAESHLIAFDGIGHHKLATLPAVSAGTVSPRALYFSQVTSTPRLWHATTENSGMIYYTPLKSLSEDPYPDFPTTGTHYLETSQINFDLPEVQKNFRDVSVEVVNATTQDSTKPPTTLADDATVGTIAWTIPGAASLASAAMTPSTTTHYLKGTVCGFSVPTGATINSVGVTIGVPIKTGPTGVFDFTVKLVVAGVITGNAKTGTLSYGSSGTRYSGSYASDVQTVSDTPAGWGVALTPATVNATNFGAVFSATGGSTLKIQQYIVSVNWTLGSVTGTCAVYFALDSSYDWHLLGTADAYSRTQTFSFTRADGTVQSAASTSFTDSALNQAADYWNDAWVDIVSGTGWGQTRRVTDFASGVCTITPAWTTNPDTTSVYQLTFQGKAIRFKLQMATDTAGYSLVVRSFTLTHEPRPPLKRGWRFRVQASDMMESHIGNIRQNMGADTIMGMLMAWRDVKAPLKYKDVDGTVYYVVVTDVQASGIIDPLNTGQQGARDYMAAVSLAQV